MNAAIVPGHLVIVIGRVLVGLTFLWSAYDKIAGFGPAGGMMRAHGVPLVRFALPAAIVLELVCGLGLIANVFVPLAAALIIVFVIVASILIPVKDLMTDNPRERHAAQVQLAGNVALVGGLLYILGSSV